MYVSAKKKKKVYSSYEMNVKYAEQRLMNDQSMVWSTML